MQIYQEKTGVEILISEQYSLKKNCYRGEGEDVGIRGKRTPMKISKIHLHVELFSLKSNWRLAERILHNQGCKMIHRKSGRKGRESVQSGL